MNFSALLPLLSNDHGHVFVYNQAVEKACSLLGWEFQAFVPRNSTASHLPANWHKVLAHYDHTDATGMFIRKNFRQQVSAFVKSLLPLFRIASQKPEGILFIESFSPAEIAALAIVIASTRPRHHLWIVLRKEPSSIPAVSGLLRRLMHWIEKNLRGTLTLLTDSELLKTENEPYFQRPVHVLPIPHTEIPEQECLREDFVWWPGGDPTRFKGLSTMQWLVQRSPGRLLVSRNAAPFFFHAKMHLEFLDPFLDRATYWELMRKSRFVLFPNEPKAYAAATSGIFVEAIAAGGVPLVRDGTWMAHELKRFGLEPLISDFCIHFDQISYSSLKLAHMRQTYRRYHCIPRFAEELASVCKQAL